MNIFFIYAIAIAVIFIIFAIVVSTRFSEKALEKRLTKMGNIVTRAQSNILNENEDILRENANKSADINKGAVKTVARAVKEGFNEADNTTMFCKYCGNSIDQDSKFCKYCGKEL